MRELRENLRSWGEKRREIIKTKAVLPLSFVMQMEPIVAEPEDKAVPFVSFRNSERLNKAIENGKQQALKVESRTDNTVDMVVD